MPEFVNSVPVPDRHSILSEQEQADLRRIASAGTQADVIRFLTPHLTRLRQPLGQSSVSAAAGNCAPAPADGDSEDAQRLDHPSGRPSPQPNEETGLPSVWRPLATFWEARQRQAQGQRASFGPVAEYRLHAGCVDEVYEARKEFTDADFGDLCAYHLCVTGPCYGMLLDATRFWLYKSLHGFPIHLVHGEWTEPGGEEAVRAFFMDVAQPELLPLLRRLLADLDTHLHFIEDPLGNKTMERRAHLGSGSYGHVFAVGDAASPAALKVVAERKSHRWRRSTLSSKKRCARRLR